MVRADRDERWLPHFRRSVRFLRPHRRLLIVGIVCALGVSASYTVSISAIIPILKVIFADHESLVDWLYRSEAERRLGVEITADVPDDPAGLRIDRVRDAGPAAEVLGSGDRIVAVEGAPLSSHGVLEAVAREPDSRVLISVRDDAGGERRVTLALRPDRWWWDALQGVAAWLPSGRDADSRMTTLAIVMAGLVLVSLFGGVARFFNDGLVKSAVQRGVHDLRTEVGRHVLRLPLSWHSRQPPGDTLARLATDINKVEVGHTTLFGKAIREPLNAIGVLSLTLAIEWRLLAVALVGVPIGILVIRVFGGWIKRSQRRVSQSWGRLLDHLGERLAGVRVVKACTMEDAEGRRFAEEDTNLMRSQTRIELVDAATKPVLELLAVLAVAAFVLYGGSRVFNQELEPHLFFAAVVCVGGVFDPVRKMGNVNNRLQAADASARRLFELLDGVPEGPRERDGVVELAPLREAILFDHVSFRYEGGPRLVLDDVSFRVEKGEVVALVGPNGSGKTTLVSLLLRFFEPTGGRILIDEQNIGQVSLPSLRRQIGLVTQEAVVFSGTLRENIAYGANGVSNEQIMEAARRAHVEDFARELKVVENGSVTVGYDARVTARTLSGGQRQRVALARAIVNDPPILILDEATSQIDSESERKIQEALEDVTQDRTTFIIAHRYSTIARADRIVVLDEGRVVAMGTHPELIGSCALYQSLCQTQFAQSG